MPAFSISGSSPATAGSVARLPAAAMNEEQQGRRRLRLRLPEMQHLLRMRAVMHVGHASEPAKLAFQVRPSAAALVFVWSAGFAAGVSAAKLPPQERTTTIRTGRRWFSWQGSSGRDRTITMRMLVILACAGGRSTWGVCLSPKSIINAA